MTPLARQPLALVALICVLLGACSAIQGQPKATIDRQVAIEKLDEQFNLAKMIGDYYEDGKSEDAKRAIRDQVIDAGIVLTDLRFTEFVERFSSTKKGADTITEIGAIGLSGAAALINPSSTTSILSALSGGLVASNASFNKNYFYEKSIPSMIKAMEGQRSSVAADLIIGQSKPTSQYSLAATITDLQRYYAAGTFEGALQSITQQAADQQTEAGERIKVEIGRAKAEISELKASYGTWLEWIKASDENYSRARGVLEGRLSNLDPVNAKDMVGVAFDSRIVDGDYTNAEAVTVFGTTPAVAGNLDMDALRTLLNQSRIVDKDLTASVLAQLGATVPGA